MKKFMLCTLLLGAFTFSACGSDDDGGASGCAECSSTAGQLTVNSTICDAGDGKITITQEDGTETTVSISPATFDQYIEGITAAEGTTCTR